MFISLVCWYIFCNIIYTQPFLEFCVISDGHRGVPLFHAILAGTEFSLRSQHLTVNPKLFKFLFQGLHDMTQWYFQNLSSQILVDIPTMKVSNSNAWVFRIKRLKTFTRSGWRVEVARWTKLKKFFPTSYIHDIHDDFSCLLLREAKI